MPHFVVKSNGFNGENNFAIEFFHSCTDINGRQYDHGCYTISNEIAAMGLELLINLYKNGVHPKPPKKPEPNVPALPTPNALALPAPEKPANPQPRNMLEMG